VDRLPVRRVIDPDPVVADNLVFGPAFDRLLQRLVDAIVDGRIQPRRGVPGDRLDQRCYIQGHAADLPFQALALHDIPISAQG
jgi:hypothetical protein